MELTRLGCRLLQWAGPPEIRCRLIFSVRSDTLMPLLIRQDKNLNSEFSSHSLYFKAYCRVKAAFLALLARTEKNSAISLLKEEGGLYFSKGFIRAVVKLRLPGRVHYVFTKTE